MPGLNFHVVHPIAIPAPLYLSNSFSENNREQLPAALREGTSSVLNFLKEEGRDQNVPHAARQFASRTR